MTFRPESTNTSEQKTNAQRRRRRKTTWFNPPFSKTVKTNVGKKFLRLIDRHFPRGSKLNKIFNRNTIKVGYSCMKNMKSIMKSHNSAILKKNNQKEPAKTCNCRNKNSCPLRGKCLVDMQLCTKRQVYPMMTDQKSPTLD